LEYRTDNSLGIVNYYLMVHNLFRIAIVKIGLDGSQKKRVQWEKEEKEAKEIKIE
jgi:hypothetical protein